MDCNEQTEDMELRAKEDEEDSPDSSCMDESKQTTVQNSDVPTSNKTTMPRVPRKKTYKHVSKRCKTKLGRVLSGGHTLALKRGKELLKNLSKEHPSFLKRMRPSNVTSKTGMGIPAEFWKSHLPTHNVEVTLENESAESYTVNFHPGAAGNFSGGWRKFSAANKLLEDDVVVFQMTRPCFFKVHIIRANDPTVAGSSNLASSSLPANKGNRKRPREAAERRVSKKANATENVAYDNHETSKRIKRGRIDSEAQTSALQKAKELQANLATEHPSFIKKIRRSHITQFFKLDVPRDFRPHLPSHSVEVILEDDSGESYTVKFHPGRLLRFISGWKRFSVVHNLLEGDVAVFHLIKPCYFKVYIIRANEPTVVGSSNSTSTSTSLDAPAKEGRTKRKHDVADINVPSLAPPHQDTVEEEVAEMSPLQSKSDLEPVPESSSKEDLHSSDMEVFSLSGRIADFENFKIIVNNEIVDSELLRPTRYKYYMLCCSRKSHLHRKLLKNVDPTLAAGIIRGTLNMVDTIRASKLETSEEDFAMWDDTLEGFKRLGMDVEFLRDRLKRLVSLASELRVTEEWKRYADAKHKLDEIEKKIKSTEMEFLELKRSIDRLDDEMKTMEANIGKCKDTFQEEAIAPW